MIPGGTTNTQPEFPEEWLGLWKDPSGKVMFVERENGRHLALSFAAGIQQPFFPLIDGPMGMTRKLPGVYGLGENGIPALRINIGDYNMGPHYDVHFIFGEGDRLRTAESWDAVTGVIARPQLVESELGHSESEDNTALSWAYPLSNYWKMDEEEMRFRAFHNL